MPPKKQQIPASASSAKKRKDRQSGMDLLNEMQAMRKSLASHNSPGPNPIPTNNGASDTILPTPKRRGRPTKASKIAEAAAASSKSQQTITSPNPQILRKTPVAAPTAQTMARTPITYTNQNDISDDIMITESVAKRRRTETATNIKKNPSVLSPVVSNHPNSRPLWNIPGGQPHQATVQNQQPYYNPGIQMPSQTPPRPSMQPQQTFVPVSNSQAYPWVAQPAPATSSSTSSNTKSTGMKAPFGSPVPESVLRRRRSSTTTAKSKNDTSAVPIMTTTVTTSKSVMPPSTVATSLVNGTTTTRTTTIKKTTIKQTTTNNDPSTGAVTRSPSLTTTTTTVSTTPMTNSAMASSTVPVPVMNTVSTTTTTIEPSQSSLIHREGATTVLGHDNPFNHETENEDDDSAYSNEDDDNSIEDGEIRSILDNLLPGRGKDDDVEDDDDDIEEQLTWQGKVEKVLMPIASMIVILIIMVIFISSLLASFCFVRCIGTTIVAFLEGSHSSNDTSWLSVVQGCYNSTGSGPNLSVVNKNDLPPCFYDHETGARPKFTGSLSDRPSQCISKADRAQLYVPCPVGGICAYGILEECIAYGTVNALGATSNDKEVINMLQKSATNDSCQLSKVGSIQLNNLKLLLDDWTFLTKCGTGYAEFNINPSTDMNDIDTGNTTCRLSLPPTTKFYNRTLSMHPLFLLNDAVKHLSLSFDDVNVLPTILDLVGSSIDMFVVSKSSFDSENTKINDGKYMVGLHTVAPTKRTPCSCRFKLLLKWVFTSMGSTIWQTICMVLSGIWHLYYDAPLITTLVLWGGTSIVVALNYVRTKRFEKQQLEENVIYLRQRVCKELSDHSNLPMPMHILIERIVWVDFPSNRKRRQYLSNIVWPYVVMDIRTDQRIAKTTQQLQTDIINNNNNVGGGQIYEHWQWMDPISFA
jgi:hypothetical protein